MIEGGIGVRHHNFTKCKTKIEEENVKLRRPQRCFII